MLFIISHINLVKPNLGKLYHKIATVLTILGYFIKGYSKTNKSVC